MLWFPDLSQCLSPGGSSSCGSLLPADRPSPQSPARRTDFPRTASLLALGCSSHSPPSAHSCLFGCLLGNISSSAPRHSPPSLGRAAPSRPPTFATAPSSPTSERRAAAGQPEFASCSDPLGISHQHAMLYGSPQCKFQPTVNLGI